ncbi:MAG: hypothetical protein JSS97_06400 [Actinobacteria bacterium]|nr:hypothetical protein [Actinomycetota bacterium]
MPPDPGEVTQILPVKQAFEDQLLKLPGVTGVDIGLKEVGGEKTTTHAILVFVAHKGEYEAEDEIPTAIAGVPTDVIEAIFEPEIARVDTAPLPQIDSRRYNPVRGGCAIAPARIMTFYGSLGMVVADAASGALLWLSNYHVMCVNSSWEKDDKRITQPAVFLNGNPWTDTIGHVLRGIQGQVVVPWGYDLYVDAAVCDTGGRKISESILGSLGTPVGARATSIGEVVKKYGVTSGLREGAIQSTNFTVVVGGITFYYQYRAEARHWGSPPLSEPGDSGAAVIDSSSYAIGIIMAGDGIRSVINPIAQIFAALNLTMPL